MDSIARFRCPHCLQITTFCPKVHEDLFGSTAFTPSYLSYEVACKYCRRPFLFAVRRPPALVSAGDSEVPRT
jgi:hypothetical protein